MRLVLAASTICILLASFASAQDRATVESRFQTWLIDVVTPRALAQGISRDTVNAAFDGVTLDWKLSGVDLPGKPPATDQKQAEFRAPAKYFNADGMAGTAAIGRKLAQRYSDDLAGIEARTGVPGRIVLAIWARESGYGRVPISYNAFRVLGTRAFASDGDYLTRELVAALKIAEARHVPIAELKSSWAGALGQPQFMPASFLAYAVDGDGDKRADIWRSEIDTMASIANFLAVHEWQAARDWGFEVIVPDTVSCALEGPDQAKPLAQWLAMGITRISGKSFPESELQGQSSLLFPAGRFGPAFLVTPNFYVLKRYNRSDLYALYVGNLGDRIQYNSGGFKGGWDRRQTLLRSDISSIQTGLEALGYDVGGVDSLPGYKTRASIGTWQDLNGQKPTCFPEKSMKTALAH